MGFVCMFEKGKFVNIEVWVFFFWVVGVDVLVWLGVILFYLYNFELMVVVVILDE